MEKEKKLEMEAEIKILFLEDRTEDYFLIQREIKKSNIKFKSMLAVDKKSYKAALHKEKPDIILSDYTLPQFNGVEAIEIAKKIYPEIPILIVTGSLNEEIAVNCMRVGAWDYLLKSNLFQLNQAIKRALSIKHDRERIKTAESQLNKNQQKLNNLIGNLAGIVYRCANSRAWSMEFISGACEEITGYRINELLNDKDISYGNIIHSDDRTFVWEKVKKALDKKLHFQIEYRIICKDKTIKWVWEQGIGIRDEFDNLIALEGYISDITIRKKAESALIESEKKYKEQRDLLNGIFNNIPDILGVQSNDHTVIRYNQAGYEFLGKGYEEVQGKKCYELIEMKSVCPDCATQISYETKKPAQIEKYVPATKRWLDIRSYPILDENGEIRQVVEHIRDITEKKQSEEQLKKDLEEKRILLQELYHRTKNNMQVVSSILSIKAYKTDKPELKEAFVDINNKIKSMALVHQKLYQSSNLSQIDLKGYTEDLVRLLIISNEIEPENLVAEIELEEIFVMIDTAIPLGLILNEIISNVFKHAFKKVTKGKISIKIYTTEENLINIEISDNGPGLPENTDLRKSSSMGLQTIFTLVNHQLKGSIEYKNENGLHWHIKIEDNLHSKRI